MLGLFLKIPSRHVITYVALATIVIAGGAQWAMMPVAEAPVEVLALPAPPPALPVPVPVPRPDIADIGKVSAPSANRRTFVTFQNRDMGGGDYAVLRQVSQSICETRCLLDGQCVSYTFNTWEGACFLKSAVSPLRLDPRGISGVLASVKVSEDSKPVAMQKVQSRLLEGDAYKTIEASSAGCTEACLADEMCLGFNQIAKGGSCELLGSMTGSLRAPGMVMAMKIQPEPERRRRSPSPDMPPEVAELFGAILRQAVR